MSSMLSNARQRELSAVVEKGPEQVRAWVKAAYKAYNDLIEIGVISQTDDKTDQHTKAQLRTQKLCLLQEMVDFMSFQIPMESKWDGVMADINELRHVFDGQNLQHRVLDFHHGCSLTTEIQDEEVVNLEHEQILSALGSGPMISVER